MNFSSLTYIFFFFPISIILFLLINRFNRTIADVFLLLASYIFYAWAGYKYALILFIYSSLVFVIGKYIEKHKNKTLLVVSITLLSLVLFTFKWYDFIALRINVTILKLIIPLGISFIIFETISYLVDIYRGDSCGNYLETLLFLSLFTKVISGPIVLWRDFNKQERCISFDNVTDGIERIIIGLSKKVIIANTLGRVATKILETQYMYSIDVLTAWIFIVIYSMQLYYDFSGYSDIALGTSEILGYTFKENFNYPYCSTSVSEFFRRWHISLGTWFKEYIYIPLGGNRSHVYRNLFIVYLITGIWHGTGYNFIVWGVYLGIIVVIERVISNKEWYINTPIVIKHIITIVLIFLGWLIFAFDSMSLLLDFVKNLFICSNVTLKFSYLIRPKTILILIISIIGSLIPINILKTKDIKKFKYPILLILFVITFIFMVNSNYSPFLYFKF